MREYAGLARARLAFHEEGPAPVDHRRPLGGVQAVERVGHGGLAYAAMTPSSGGSLPPPTGWILCRRATAGVRRALALYPETAQRARTTGRGEGGDLALVIDRAAEDAVFAELEALGVGLTAVSEERGEVLVAGGGRPTSSSTP